MNFKASVCIRALLLFILPANAKQNTVREECIIKNFDEVTNVTSNCKDIILDSLSVPGGQQLALNLTEGTTLTLRGNTSFNYYEWSGFLITIFGNNIKIIGEKDSVLDGRGPLWWDGEGKWGNITKPRFAYIYVTNAILDGINIKDCPLSCVYFTGQNVVVKNWYINNLSGDEGVAPANKYAHNSDGINIVNDQANENITVENSIIYNQDDCVVIARGKNITVRNMFCHGSHGLTISAGNATIEDITFESSIVTMSENGIHVKAKLLRYGIIKNVTYRDITLLDCKSYGVYIQQNYQDLPEGEPQDGSPSNDIPIHNLTLENIYGNVLSGGIPVYIICAEEGCFNWKWNNVNILGANTNNCTGYEPEGYDC